LPGPVFMLVRRPLVLLSLVWFSGNVPASRAQAPDVGGGTILREEVLKKRKEVLEAQARLDALRREQELLEASRQRAGERAAALRKHGAVLPEDALKTVRELLEKT